MHPSASGEVKIAASVADALAGLGIGAPYPRPLPDAEPVPVHPAVLTVRPGPGQALLQWVRAARGLDGLRVAPRRQSR